MLSFVFAFNSRVRFAPSHHSTFYRRMQHQKYGFMIQLLNVEEKSTVNGAEGLVKGARKKIPTDKGKQYEIKRLKNRRTVAPRHVTGQINKVKPLLTDFNNFEFMLVEIAQDNFLEVLKNVKILPALIRGMKFTMEMC